MKKHNFLKLFAVALALFIVPLIALAAEFEFGDESGLAASQTIQNDLYIAGGTVTISGDVRGDVYTGGGTIIINGSITQDLVAAGGTITIFGNTGDDVRAAGGTLVIDGSVGGDVVAGGGTIHINGPVEGDIRIGAGDVYLNAPIRGRVEIDADKLTIGSKAVIYGDLTYRSRHEATIENGAQVLGTLNYEPRNFEKGRKFMGKFGSGIWALFTVVKFFMILAGALIIGLFFRRYMTELTGRVYDKALAEFGRGFAFLVLLPISSVILLFTIIGAPLGILGLVSFVGGLIFICLIAPVVLGSLLHKWITKGQALKVNWKTILLGVAIFSLLTFIPILGWIAQFVLVLATLGAAVHMKWQIVKSWR